MAFAPKAKIEQQIDQIMIAERCSTIEAVLSYCEQKQIDPSDLGKKLSKELMRRIEEEAINLNMIKR